MNASLTGTDERKERMGKKILSTLAFFMAQCRNYFRRIDITIRYTETGKKKKKKINTKERRNILILGFILIILTAWYPC